MMLPTGVDVNPTTQQCDRPAQNSGTAQAWACESGRVRLVKLLLAQKGIDVSISDLKGKTALGL